jgi:nitroimidazol reductase NimA-like FMN-containing flavoprotein (pyridoxamine 5'-phosphate oxidase superfamily)
VQKPPRRLEPEEIEALLALDVPARLATLDGHGFPHVTPLWFVWAKGAFHMTSIVDRPHLRRLEGNARAGVCVDVEEPEREDGQRPNRQVRAIGSAELFADESGSWTRRITGKYVTCPGAVEHASHRAADQRLVIRLRPSTLVGFASV